MMSVLKRWTGTAWEVVGPGQAGTSGQTPFVTCGVSSNGGSEPVDCFAICPLVNGTVTSATVTTAKQTVPSGSGNGFAVAFQAIGGSIPGTVYLDWIMVEVSNIDGTEKIGLFHSYTANTHLLNMTSVFSLADLTAFETVGSDLAVSADHLSVDSTAGGQLECEVTFQVAYVAP
jgi:hypothetical protein